VLAAAISMARQIANADKNRFGRRDIYWPRRFIYAGRHLPPENHGRCGSIYAGRHLPPEKIIAATVLFMPAGTCHPENQGRGGLFMPAGTCHPENHGRGGSIYAGRHLPPGKIIAATILFMPAGTCHPENHGRGGSIYAGRHLPPGKIIAATILFMPAGTCHQEKT
jgi:hypothetical protein